MYLYKLSLNIRLTSRWKQLQVLTMCLESHICSVIICFWLGFVLPLIFHNGSRLHDLLKLLKRDEEMVFMTKIISAFSINVLITQLVSERYLEWTVELILPVLGHGSHATFTVFKLSWVRSFDLNPPLSSIDVLCKVLDIFQGHFAWIETQINYKQMQQNSFKG